MIDIYLNNAANVATILCLVIEVIKIVIEIVHEGRCRIERKKD